MFSTTSVSKSCRKANIVLFFFICKVNFLVYILFIILLYCILTIFFKGKDREYPTSPIYIAPMLRNVWTFDESVAHEKIDMVKISCSDIEKEVEVIDNSYRKTT